MYLIIDGNNSEICVYGSYIETWLLLLYLLLREANYLIFSLY